ncbi:hypothetical protein T439DRAFT_325183 [Meredithblackwellia eburnea MCA 4105]
MVPRPRLRHCYVLFSRSIPSPPPPRQTLAHLRASISSTTPLDPPTPIKNVNDGVSSLKELNKTDSSSDTASVDQERRSTAKPPFPSPSTSAAPSLPPRSQADRDADAIRALEARFGGQECTMLGILEDGKPQGLAKNVSRNMFRVIGNG